MNLNLGSTGSGTKKARIPIGTAIAKDMYLKNERYTLSNGSVENSVLSKISNVLHFSVTCLLSFLWVSIACLTCLLDGLENRAAFLLSLCLVA